MNRVAQASFILSLIEGLGFFSFLLASRYESSRKGRGAERSGVEWEWPET
jgi:hypothetical protein